MFQLLIVVMLVGNWQGITTQPSNRDVLLYQRISSADRDIHNRVLLELAEKAERSAILDKRLIEWFLSPQSDHDDVFITKLYRLAPVLSAQNIRPILDHYHKARHPESAINKILPIFGRMKSNAREAVPFLQELRKQRASDTSMAIAVDIVLANIEGNESIESSVRIKKTIREHPDLKDTAINAIAILSPGSWFDNELLQIVLEEFEKDGNPSAAGVLLQLKGKDDIIHARLAQLTVSEQDSAKTILLDIILATTGSSNRRALLNDAIKMYGRLEMYMQLAICLWFPPSMVQELLECIEPRHPDVSIQAMVLLSRLGILKPYNKHFIDMVINGTSDEQIVALDTIYRIGSIDIIPELEKMLDTSRSTSLEPLIKKAIRVIKLQLSEQ